MLDPDPYPKHIHQASSDSYCDPIHPDPNSYLFTPAPAPAHQSTTVQVDQEVEGSEDDGDEDRGAEGGGDGEGEGDGGMGSTGSGDRIRSQSDESGGKSDGRRQSDGSMKKRPRITLARGGACVTCRNRKLKCTGEKPCKSCVKASIECRYEEIQRRKPRAVLLEERVVELEALLASRGEKVPPSQLSGPPTYTSPVKQISHTYSAGSSSTSRSSFDKISPPVPASNQPAPFPATHAHSDYTLPINTLTLRTDNIPPNSPLELALIQIVLPHTPHLLMPVHPQRFLALLALRHDDPGRPHPALLYILFAEAVRIIEKGIPPPRMPTPPPGMFAQPFTPYVPPPIDTSWILPHVQGMTTSLMERARVELDSGIRNVDRPFDLVRAAVAIARHLYSAGRFIEGWSIPVSKLLISCGLHRQTGTIISTDGLSSSTSGEITGFLPGPYAETNRYIHCHTQKVSGTSSVLPTLRMRPVIIPPPRDEIEYAERVMTFWAVKSQDWEAGIGWGWTLSLSDDECTTEFPWGWSGASEVKMQNMAAERYAISDLHNPDSGLHLSPYPDSTYTLAFQSLGLYHRACYLFDRPESSQPTLTPSGVLQPPTHIAPLPLIQEVEQALRLFRNRIPQPFQDHSTVSLSNPNVRLNSYEHEYDYDGSSDPWWIMLHSNLYTAEMVMWREMAHYQRGGYERAVSCARALVVFVKRLKGDDWVHVDMIVALNLSLAARFLNKESERLRASHQVAAAGLAQEEAEVLKRALSDDYSRWMDMARMQGIIVQRVKDGWSEKEGEYERV